MPSEHLKLAANLQSPCHSHPCLQVLCVALEGSPNGQAVGAGLMASKLPGWPTPGQRGCRYLQLCIACCWPGQLHWSMEKIFLLCRWMFGWVCWRKWPVNAQSCSGISWWLLGWSPVLEGWKEWKMMYMGFREGNASLRKDSCLCYCEWQSRENCTYSRTQKIALGLCGEKHVRP